jgi:hypothetical protein
MEKDGITHEEFKGENSDSEVLDVINDNTTASMLILVIQKRNQSPEKYEEEAQFELNTAFVEDPARTRRLRWKVDLK